MENSFTWGGGPQIVLLLCGLSPQLLHWYPWEIFINGGINLFFITGALFLVFGIPFINLQVVVLVVVVLVNVITILLINVWTLGK